MPTVIQVDNLSKRYQLGLIGGKTLREDVQRWWAKARGKPDPLLKIGQENAAVEDGHIWALRDIDFSVRQGEVLGIIGRNGAGKSTLLKILTRITAPTTGRARMKGRVASMLEVGTGFHPELTGRENVYLNGAILGMTKSDVDRKFDEIVAFSGVESYVDTPVKRYSSGMRVRLAFAVAAHLDPEILLIDEVLAVGDAGFQQKCIGKMDEAAGDGRTVLFVSHQLDMVNSLCSRTMLLDEGRVVADGDTADVVKQYYELLKRQRVDAKTALGDPQSRRGHGTARFSDIVIEDGQGTVRHQFHREETAHFRLTFRVFEEVEGLDVTVLLRSGATREPLTSVTHRVADGLVPEGHEETVVVEVPLARLRPATYPLYFWLGNAQAAASDQFRSRRPYDVVDDLTAPLVVTGDGITKGRGGIEIDSNLRRIVSAHSGAYET